MLAFLFAALVATGWEGPFTPDYQASIDHSVKHSGRSSLLLKATGTGTGDSIRQRIRADQYRGKRIRLTGWINTDKAEQGGALWLRVDMQNGDYVLGTALAAIAPMLVEPNVRTTQVSQLLRGHAAEVIARQGVWLNVRMGDDYEGWIHQGYVQSVPGDGPLIRGWDDTRPLSLGCTVRDAGGGVRKLPLGALLSEGEARTSGLAMSLEERRASFAPTGDAITATAVTYFESASYEWGGVTPWGADCSGIVQSCFALHGVHLPRDAWMQAESGTPLPPDFEVLVPGDLLFFSDDPSGRITHVAMSLGGSQVVHQALGRGGHAVDDLASSEEYPTLCRGRIRCARRILS